MLGYIVKMFPSGAMGSCRAEMDSWGKAVFRKMNPRVECLDGLVEREPGGREICWEMFPVVQMEMAGGDAILTSLRKGNGCQRHNKARAKGLGDIERKHETFPEVW